MHKELEQVLAAKEERWQLRQQLAKEGSVLSMTLCVPLPLRTAPRYGQLLDAMFEAFCKQIQQSSLSCHRLTGGDGFAMVASFACPSHWLKQQGILWEETTPGGRLLDLDVTDSQGDSVGRAELEEPPRPCFLCDHPSAYCVVNHSHSKEEILQKAEELAGQAEAFLTKRQ